MQNLNKRNATQPVNKPAGTDIRDRLATLLCLRHEKLRVVAYYFYGEEYDEYVPLLMSRQISRTPEPGPGPGPGPGSEPSEA